MPTPATPPDPTPADEPAPGGEPVPELGPEPGPDAAVRRVADRLALALEDVGFDVGRAFPQLGTVAGRDGQLHVALGRVTAVTADQLATLLDTAARGGLQRPGADET